MVDTIVIVERRTSYRIGGGRRSGAEMKMAGGREVAKMAGRRSMTSLPAILLVTSLITSQSLVFDVAVTAKRQHQHHEHQLRDPQHQHTSSIYKHHDHDDGGNPLHP